MVDEVRGGRRRRGEQKRRGRKRGKERNMPRPEEVGAGREGAGKGGSSYLF